MTAMSKRACASVDAAEGRLRAQRFFWCTASSYMYGRGICQCKAEQTFAACRFPPVSACSAQASCYRLPRVPNDCALCSTDNESKMRTGTAGRAWPCFRFLRALGGCGQREKNTLFGS